MFYMVLRVIFKNRIRWRSEGRLQIKHNYVKNVTDVEVNSKTQTLFHDLPSQTSVPSQRMPLVICLP